MTPDPSQVNRFLEELKRREGLEPPGGEFRFSLSDKGNGQRLAHRHGQDLRYCEDWKRWLVWDGQRWRADNTGEVMRKAKQTVEAIPAEGAEIPDREKLELLHKHAARSQSWKSLRDMVLCAASEPPIPVTPEQFDQHAYLLNVLNGTIDLRTGEMHGAERTEHLTKIAPVEYDPHAECPLWESFLERIMFGDPAMISFLRRAAGYSLTGDVSERALFIFHGSGANGKSTFLQTLRELWGEYAHRTGQETLLTKREGSIPADVAKLKGARLVTASETTEGRKLDEALVKDLTGNETIAARLLHSNWFEFKPECKIWLGTNHRPDIKTGGKALFDRIKLVPFAYSFPEKEQDKHFAERLRGEFSGILNWAIQGCLEWQREGLGVPPKVIQATRDYQLDVDAFGAFLAEMCVVGEAHAVQAQDMWKAYEYWRLGNGEKQISQKRLGMTIRDRGFGIGHNEKGSIYRGLALKYRPPGLTDDAS